MTPYEAFQWSHDSKIMDRRLRSLSLPIRLFRFNGATILKSWIVSGLGSGRKQAHEFQWSHDSKIMDSPPCWMVLEFLCRGFQWSHDSKIMDRQGFITKAYSTMTFQWSHDSKIMDRAEAFRPPLLLTDC